MCSVEIKYDDQLPDDCPVLMIRIPGKTRIVIHPAWAPVIEEAGLEGAVEILDEMMAGLDRQDGTPMRDRRTGVDRRAAVHLRLVS